MASILQSLNKTIIAGTVLLLILLIIMFRAYDLSFDLIFWQTIFRYKQCCCWSPCGLVFFGISILFKFLICRIYPMIKSLLLEKVIAPAALFWFRWAALATVITGLITLALYYGQYKENIN